MTNPFPQAVAPEEASFRVLTEHEANQLLHRLAPYSRPLRSLLNRLSYFERDGATLVWAWQTLYRVGNPGFDSDPSLSLDHPNVPADRLILGRGDVACSDFELLATLVVRREHYRGRLIFPPQVERVVIGAPQELVRGNAYMMGVPLVQFVPWIRSMPWRFPTFPYRGQEPSELTCIDSCLWMSFDYLHRQIGHRQVPISALREPDSASGTHLAVGRPLDEVRQLIADAGYRPMIAWVDRRDEGDLVDELPPSQATKLSPAAFVEVLHAYVDSQLPVILILKRKPRLNDDNGSPVAIVEDGPPSLHSLVVVGHTFYLKSKRDVSSSRHKMEKQLGFTTTTDFLDEFIVHDDDIGPYMRLPVGGQGFKDFGDPDHLYCESIEKNACAMFVPLPPDVRVTAEQVMAMTSVLLRDRGSTELMDGFVDRYAAEEDRPLEPVMDLVGDYRAARDSGDLVLSFYLDRSSRFRRNLVQVDAGGYLLEQDRAQFLAEPLPRYVWVVEVSTSVRRSQGGDAMVLGELVFDASVSAPGVEASLIIGRIPGVLLRNSGQVRLRPSLSRTHSHWLIRNFEDRLTPGEAD